MKSRLSEQAGVGHILLEYCIYWPFMMRTGIRLPDRGGDGNGLAGHWGGGKPCRLGNVCWSSNLENGEACTKLERFLEYHGVTTRFAPFWPLYRYQSVSVACLYKLRASLRASALYLVLDMACTYLTLHARTILLAYAGNVTVREERRESL